MILSGAGEDAEIHPCRKVSLPRCLQRIVTLMLADRLQGIACLPRAAIVNDERNTAMPVDVTGQGIGNHRGSGAELQPLNIP
mgnify:CR=1 FL=1